MKPWGLCVHTSGRGILSRALRDDMDPVDAALKWYRASTRSGVHYVVGWDGCLFQMLDDNKRGAHVGLSRKDRRAYLDGSWMWGKSQRALTLWRNKWARKSPQHLYPAKSVNDCYIGIEMVPLPALRVGSDGLWFTPAQHEAVRHLACDLAHRHKWPKGWQFSPRLLGHEDVSSHGRWDNGGGWDPGALRTKPRFDWSAVRR
jgi:N-acetyl-anhydromuramyl-L-alanine amidase AmpD